MLFGWGLFNLVEGVIDHHILQVHHVIQQAPLELRLYIDLAFLGFGILQILLGRWLIARAKLEMSYARA